MITVIRKILKCLERILDSSFFSNDIDVYDLLGAYSSN